jgi:hypothetical protein
LNKTPAKNDLDSAVPKFCFGLEVHRRTPDGRTRTAQEFLAHFFPHDGKSATDRIFRHLPNHVRAPILTTWGVRGKKSALMDDDAKVQSVVHDALVAGDIDSGMFEEAFAPDTIMRWIDLSDWWTFWRGGKLTKFTILKALESAYELELFDAGWFLDTLRGRGGKLRGTDVLAEGLTKADLTEWVRRVHEGGDGSPKGLVAALGWDQIVAKTEDDVLVAVCDAMAVKVSLAAEPDTKVSGKVEPKTDAKPEVTSDPKADPKPDAKVETKPEAKVEAKPEAKVETKPDAKVEAKPEGKVEAKPDAKAEAKSEAKGDPKLAAKVEGKVETPPAKVEAKVETPPAKVATKDEPKPDAQAIAKAPALPGILIPSTAVRTGGGEQSIDSEAAANLFKDDELIPISSGTWEEGDESSEHGQGERRGSKPPGKRASKSPPAARGSK